ncbi:MAG TPA: hypothetical protein VL981_00960 [Candidatus Methylacidiphilales bacterium]|nr:hypothetical protein [Candidatus Methylacidiphilales bacterium]
MSDPTPTPAPVAATTTVTRLAFYQRPLVAMLSLGLNALLLLLIIVGITVHCFRHHERRGFGGRFGRGGPGGGYGYMMAMQQGFGGRHFHRFDGGFGGGERWGGYRDRRFDRDGGRGGHRHGHGSFGGKRGGRHGHGQRGFGGGHKGDGHRGSGGNGPGKFNQERGGGFWGGMGRGFGMRGMMGGPNGQADPAKATDAILNRLTRRLTLTADQQAKIKPIILQQVTDMQKQMDAQRQAMQKLVTNTKAQIKALLTPDQQKQFDAMPLPGQRPPPPLNAPPPPNGAPAEGSSANGR